jgi:Fic family protein
MYNYDRKDWPKLSWDEAGLARLLIDVRHHQGRLLGRMEALGFPSREEATLRTLTEDVIKTSEIEGEKLDADQVRSSIAKRMGLDIGALPQYDRNLEGIVDVMLDATRNHDIPLTKQRLFDWHAALFPTGRSGLQRITVGRWRTEASDPMRVISGPYGREKIRFEAPASDRLDDEMLRFLKWFNAPPETDLVIASALAHFWFVTIHPFDDGNGRIARAIADMVLARSEKSSQRFYSMSSQIQHERKAYYDLLERCQKGGLNISIWIEWYLECLKRAISAAEKTLGSVLIKARFWRLHAGESLNERQQLIINRLLDHFEGKLTSSKWARLTKSSQDTALRDINDLMGRQILTKEDAGGRSTSYVLRQPTSS